MKYITLQGDQSGKSTDQLTIRSDKCYLQVRNYQVQEW